MNQTIIAQEPNMCSANYYDLAFENDWKSLGADKLLVQVKIVARFQIHHQSMCHDDRDPGTRSVRIAGCRCKI